MYIYSYLVGLEAWAFPLFHSVCMETAKALSQNKRFYEA